MSLLNIKNIDAIEAVPTGLVFEYLGVSIVLGILLMFIAVWSSRKIGEKLGSNYGALKEAGKGEKSERVSYAELILGSANVLFICFGMTGIMILVNNNLARAFAIGAAIAVIRFKVKFDAKGVSSTLFFGMLVGMACGVGQIETATGITIAYGVLQSIIILLISLDMRGSKSSRNLPPVTNIITSTKI